MAGLVGQGASSFRGAAPDKSLKPNAYCGDFQTHIANEVFG